MVRHYKRKRHTNIDNDYLNELANEFQATKGQVSLRHFAKTKGVAYTTAYRCVKKIIKKKGPCRPTVLSEEEEILLSTALKFLGDSNMGQDREDIRTMVEEFQTRH